MRGDRGGDIAEKWRGGNSRGGGLCGGGGVVGGGGDARLQRRLRCGGKGKKNDKVEGRTSLVDGKGESDLL